MDSDEEFSLTPEIKPSEETLEGVNGLITAFKEQHEQLIRDQRLEASRRDDLRDLAQQYKQRADKVCQNLREDQISYEEKLQSEKLRLDTLRQDEKLLMQEIERVEAAVKDQEKMNSNLKLQDEVITGVPERTIVFNGCTADAANGSVFDVESNVVYPMEGGTALITFEDRQVAINILDMKIHRVDLGEENACSITVEAKPVQLMMPQLVEMLSEVCSQRILISNLPRVESENMRVLLLELNVHFAKRRNGGGEVDDCEMLPDSGSVVITFVEKNVVRGLTDTEYHEVTLQGKKHKVRVTPFLNGHITQLETKMTMCPRTVLLTGIPAIMEKDTLQDLLEIHFQKNGNGGGEIETILYNPLGQNTLALFEGGTTGLTTGAAA